MGSSISWADNFKKNFEVDVSSFEHPYFGSISTYKKSNDPSIQVFGNVVKKVQVNDVQMKGLKNRLKIRHPNLVALLYIEEEPSQGCMSGRNGATIHMEYPGMRTLANVLSTKINYWNEPQLWEMIDQVVEACAELQKNNLQHGDIRPEMMMVNDNMIKLMECCLMPGVKTGYQNAWFGTFSYLSPTQIHSYKQQLVEAMNDSIKSDVYSFGMTLMHMATLTSPSSCYNFSDGVIIDEAVHKYYTEISRRYSPCLLSFIQFCLTISEQDRPTFIDIQTLLKPYTTQIHEGEIFTTGIVFCNCSDNHHFGGVHVSPQKTTSIQSNYQNNIQSNYQNNIVRSIIPTQSPARLAMSQPIISPQFVTTPIQSLMSQPIITPQFVTTPIQSQVYESPSKKGIFYGKFPDSAIKFVDSPQQQNY